MQWQIPNKMIVCWLQAKQALRGGRGVALSIPDSGNRGVGNIMPLPIYPKERNLIPQSSRALAMTRTDRCSPSITQHT